MSRYKKTLILPRTDFPMRARLAEREPQMLARWQAINLYERAQALRRGQKRFILHDGPPYANGAIHIGHAVNKLLKDFIVKSRLLSGFHAPYIPGWDCHGLPIELEVEKQQGRPRDSEQRAAFRQACRDYASRQVAAQKSDFIRLGVLGDWDKPYLSMHKKTQADILRVLGDVIKRGFFVRKNRPVYWCKDCESALAEAEIEYREKKSQAIDVRFVFEQPDALARAFGVDETLDKSALVIWTTTPWTLPANRAVAVHKDFSYGLYAGSAGFLVLAEKLAADCLARYQIKDGKKLACASGQKLLGLMLRHPFYQRTVPVVAAEHVTLETGTGAVHIAPAHGHEDYQTGQTYQLQVDDLVDQSGCFRSGVPLVGKNPLAEAEKNVLAALSEQKNLLCHEVHEHSYPHCWRHKTPLLFRAAPQWFIPMDESRGDGVSMRQKALMACAGVKWIPGWGRERMQGMLEERPDWCISRQRYWGVPIAVFFHRDSGELHPRSVELIERVAQKIESGGVQAWFDLSAGELLSGAEAQVYQKADDVLDVWFDSGATHSCVLARRPELDRPADLYLEGSDQHRGWFQSSLLLSVAQNEQAPYREVLTHGFVVDAHGQKMSKSRGNVIAPQKIIETLGADVLRLWAASTNFSAEMAVSDEILKQTAEAYRRIRNTARFLLANLSGFDPKQHAQADDQLLSLERWLLDTARQLQQAVISDYHAYRFHRLCQRIHNFCNVQMGGFYLDVIKDRLYTLREDHPARRSAQTAMYHVVQAFARWLAPILSYTAEEIYQHVPGEKKDHVLLEAGWYERLPALGDSRFSREDWVRILAVRDLVNKQLETLRADCRIGSPLDADVHLYCGEQDRVLLGDKLGGELYFLLLTSSACIHPMEQRPADAVLEQDIAVVAAASKQSKCVRCWHHDASVGRDSKDPEICMRCIGNIYGQDEERHHV